MTPWTVAHQYPLSMGFSRQEYWSGLPFPIPRDPWPSDQTLCLLHFLHWWAGSLSSEPLDTEEARNSAFLSRGPVRPGWGRELAFSGEPVNRENNIGWRWSSWHAQEERHFWKKQQPTGSSEKEVIKGIHGNKPVQCGQPLGWKSKALDCRSPTKDLCEWLSNP